MSPTVDDNNIVTKALLHFFFYNWLHTVSLDIYSTSFVLSRFYPETKMVTKIMKVSKSEMNHLFNYYTHKSKIV